MASSEPRRLTTDGRWKTDPVFTSGGQEIVFTLQEKPTQMSLLRLRLADGSVERLHPDATTSEFEAAFTPDGKTYAFVQSRGNLNLKLVIRQAGTESVFDPGGGFASIRRPSLLPDGSRVFFSIPSPAGQRIVSVDRQGKDLRELTAEGINNWPAVAPDGKRIAFASSREGDFEIYVIDAAGGNVRRLTHSAGLDIRPAWSPDGRRLAFTSNRDGCYAIYVMAADGTQPRRLTHRAERDDYAAWHPDGQRLVVVSERGGQSDLYLLDVPDQ